MSMKNRYTLKNDFHNTEVTVLVAAGEPLSIHQERRVNAALCGISDCSCGAIRGPQEVTISGEFRFPGDLAGTLYISAQNPENQK